MILIALAASTFYPRWLEQSHTRNPATDIDLLWPYVNICCPHLTSGEKYTEILIR